jgi:hypothetical protein
MAVGYCHKRVEREYKGDVVKKAARKKEITNNFNDTYDLFIPEKVEIGDEKWGV